jgi:hypothetical protein
MPSLRFIATLLAAALMAFGLSVGAALAEGPHDEREKTRHYTPAGLCLLEDGTKK